MVAEDMDGAGKEKLILSIINVSKAAKPMQLVPIVEAWLKEGGAVMYTRCWTFLYATADVEVPGDLGRLLRKSLAETQRAEWLGRFGCDVNLAPDLGGDGSARKGLFVFDLDSTLIQIECIDEIARLAGVYEQVAEITEEAMRGNLDFKESLFRRLGLLRGIPAEDTFQRVIEKLPLTAGVQSLAHELGTLGYITAIVSGGFLPIAEHVRRHLGFTLCFANVLEEDDQGRLTGLVVGDVIDGAKKREIMLTVASKHQIPLDKVVTVGDGANDIPMLKAAGTGIAFNAKPRVQSEASCCLNSTNISLVLPILGLEAYLDLSKI